MKHADVVSGSEGMTLLVHLCGCRDDTIDPAFIIFTRYGRSYLIKDTPDDIKCVSYRSGPKGWINKDTFPKYFQESKVINKLLNGRKMVLFLDNYSGHNVKSELRNARSATSTELHYFHQTPTHLLQPCICNSEDQKGMAIVVGEV